jgi:hypothetical protein
MNILSKDITKKKTLDDSNIDTPTLRNHIIDRVASLELDLSNEFQALLQANFRQITLTCLRDILYLDDNQITGSPTHEIQHLLNYLNTIVRDRKYHLRFRVAQSHINSYKGHVFDLALRRTYGEEIQNEAQEIQSAIDKCKALESENTLEAKFQRLQIEFFSLKNYFNSFQRELCDGPKLSLSFIFKLQFNDFNFVKYRSEVLLGDKIDLFDLLKPLVNMEYPKRTRARNITMDKINEFKNAVLTAALQGSYGEEIQNEAQIIQSAIDKCKALESENTLEAKFQRLQIEFGFTLRNIFEITKEDIRHKSINSPSILFEELALYNVLKPLDLNGNLGKSKRVSQENLEKFKASILDQALIGSYGDEIRAEGVKIQNERYPQPYHQRELKDKWQFKRALSGEFGDQWQTIASRMQEQERVAEVFHVRSDLKSKLERLQMETFDGVVMTMRSILNLTLRQVRDNYTLSESIQSQELYLFDVLKPLDPANSLGDSRTKVNITKLKAFKETVYTLALKRHYTTRFFLDAMAIQEENVLKQRILSPEAWVQENRPVLGNNFACDSMDEWIIGKFLLNNLKASDGSSFQITNDTFQVRVQSPNNTVCRFDYVIPAWLSTDNRHIVLEWHPFRKDLVEKQIKGQLQSEQKTEIRTKLQVLLYQATSNDPQFAETIKTNYATYRQELAQNHFEGCVETWCFQNGYQDKENLFKMLNTHTLWGQNSSISTYEQFQSQWLRYSEEIRTIQADKKILRAAIELNNRLIANKNTKTQELLEISFKFHREHPRVADIKSILNKRGKSFSNDQEFITFLLDFIPST